MYKFYMQLANINGAPIANTKKDLEVDFKGLHYMACEGLEAKGAPKNIYLENYADASGSRVYHPKDKQEAVTYNDTKITLKLLFESDSFRETYKSFVEYIGNGRVFFWDTVRKKKVLLVSNEEIAPKEDNVTNGFITVELSFINIWGIGKPCNENGTLV